MAAEEKPRTVKLYCPSLAKLIQIPAWDEQRLDLGCMSRAFGLDPSTLKINGHFISRGVDLIASSVTWRSLLSFFSSKGLSTGKHDRDAIIVDGKLFKVGNKRAHISQDAESGTCNRREYLGGNENRDLQDTEGSLLGNKKLKQGSSGSDGSGVQMSKSNIFGLKRKQLMENLSLLKKLKVNERNPGGSPDLERGGKNLFGNISSTQFSCSYMSTNMKRTREEEGIMAAPCKKIR